MTTRELINYYANLLILQYLGKPKAYATVKALVNPVVLAQVSTQSISFSPAPASGAFTLLYNGNATASIAWNDNATTIQTRLRALAGLASITVTGSIAAGLVVTFTGVTPPALILVVGANTLASTITILETDDTLPLAIQNAFNLIGSDIAEGVQLDVLGKYLGVTRSGNGFTGPVVLSDADFLVLIRFATIVNTSGSSLSDIQNALHQFFNNEIFVYDYQNMHMSYLVDSDLGSQDLIQLIINENLLPKPMAVQLATVIYYPILDMFFGFRTYLLPGFRNNPFNNYAAYQTNWPWLTYQDGLPLQVFTQMAAEDGSILTQENNDLIYYG